MFLSLCCRWFSFCINFLYGRILFLKEADYFLSMSRVPGWGIVSFRVPREWRIEHQLKKKLQIPGGCAQGGWQQQELNHA